jgi:hypothetical protein
MRVLAVLLVGVLVAVGDCFGAAAGMIAKSAGPAGSPPPGVVAANRASCWSGPIQLVASATSANPGEIIALATSGSNPALLEGGNITTFEADTPAGWSVVNYLGSPGGDETTYGVIPFSPHIIFAGVGTSGTVKVRVPDVSAGRYRLVRFYNSVYQGSGGILSGFPTRGANLCATISVASAPSALRVANDVAISATPSSGLRDGSRVQVSLRGFGSGGHVWLSECAFSDIVTALGCGASLNSEQLVRVDSSGRGEATVVVHAQAQAVPGKALGAFSCANNCVLVATLGGNYGFAMVPLGLAQSGAAIGTLTRAGGPFPGAPVAISGRVTFTSSTVGGSQSLELTTAFDGEFSIVLAPGHYRATGASPQVIVNGKEMLCRAPDPIVITPHDTTEVAVTCDVP